MRRAANYLFYLLLLLLLLALPSAIRWLRYNNLQTVEREAPPAYEPAGIPQLVPTPGSADFTDRPEVGQGQVLLDLAHDNLFDLSEISYMDSRLAARGYELTHFAEGDLANYLRPVDAFIVIAPMTPFSQYEVLAVADFVERGGRVLMAGDPTRISFDFDKELFLAPSEIVIDTDEIPLNSLANEFDLVFNGDYVYNTVENEGNFRNIILQADGFAEDDLTDGLEKLAFYGSHSLQVGNSGRPLLSADENTWSSDTDRPGILSLAATDDDGRVIALGDIDFLSEPYFTVFDNQRFIAQIADFLTGQERAYVLFDFPYFYGDEVDLVYTGNPELGADAFDEIIRWQDAFRRIDKDLSLANEPDGDRDVLYLGLYNQSADVEEILESAGVSLVIDPPIVEEEPSDDEDDTGEEDGEDEDSSEQEFDEEQSQEGMRLIESDLGPVQMSGTSLIILDEAGGRRQVVVLAASSEGLENTAQRLASLIPAGAEDSLSDCLLQDSLALCPTLVDDEPVEFKLETGGAPDEPEPEEPVGDEDQEEDEVLEESGGDLLEEPEAQGTISIDEQVEATLEADEFHTWIFNEGPATINIVLSPDEDMDGILELYGPEGQLLAAADSYFSNEEERLDLIQIEDDAEYAIVVRDFFNDGGKYSLRIDPVTPEKLGVVEKGLLTIGEEVEDELEEGEVHAWSLEVDDPITVDMVLQSGPELDGLLVLFDPDNQVLVVVDESLAGGEERLEEASLDNSGVYTIAITEYSRGGGSYSLLIELSG